jgi:hypothetical protein
LQTFARLVAAFQFPANRGDQVFPFNAFALRQVPQVIEVARFVSRGVGKSHDFLSSNFLERINKNRSIVREIAEFFLAPEDDSLDGREDDEFIDRDVHFHVAAPG